jgi:hypothetical protein
MTYPGYIDLATGKTLICEPGGTYDITPDSVPTDGRFTEVIPEKNKTAPGENPPDKTESDVTEQVASTKEVKESDGLESASPASS